VDAIAW